MIRLKTAAFALLTSTSLTLAAFGQAPATDAVPANPSVNATPRPAKPRPTSVQRTQAQNRRRSIVHHYPYPYPGYYHNDRSAGWRNPGGVGRYAEYYPPGDQFQSGQAFGRDPVRPAQFDSGGGIPTRQDQLQAQQIGIQRDRNLQQHIDNYARPYFGYGFGVGYFGGFY